MRVNICSSCDLGCLRNLGNPKRLLDKNAPL